MTKQSKEKSSMAYRDKLRANILKVGRKLIADEGLSSVQARRIGHRGWMLRWLSLTTYSRTSTSLSSL